MTRKAKLNAALTLERFGPTPERERRTRPKQAPVVYRRAVVRVDDNPDEQAERRRTLCQTLDGTYIDGRPDNVIPLRQAS